jgi:hypothetical protein
MLVESLDDIMQTLGKEQCVDNECVAKINSKNAETMKVDEYPRCSLSFSE